MHMSAFSSKYSEFTEGRLFSKKERKTDKQNRQTFSRLQMPETNCDWLSKYYSFALNLKLLSVHLEINAGVY